ncbi:tandem-95 repeat protein, partial [Alteromonas sp. KUL42]|uniref:Ig-like domain-containing protein n=1 Tax=Alteromonas sp. KUL42 TaxID=2480797 RepID=UPI00103582B6
VPAGVAQDDATNTNTAATQFEVTYDTVAPTVVISGPTSDTNSAFTATFTFSEAVIGFTGIDIVAGNASVSDFTVINSLSYTATITPTADGTVTLDVGVNAAQDGAGNNSVAAAQYSTNFDATSPTLVISSNVVGGVTNSSFTATFTFSEDVTGFSSSDVVATNATVGIVSSTSASIYTATITPSNDGEVTLNVGANSAQDVAGNGNIAAVQFATLYDASSPSVVISSDLEGDITNAPFEVTFTFSEGVSGFTGNDIAITNASVGTLTTESASVYSTTITPANDGAVTLSIPANAAQDDAGNNNTASALFSLSFDSTSPQLLSSTPAHNDVDVANARLQVRLVFNEEVVINGGNISLVNLADSSVVESLSLLGASVTSEATSITANFAATLIENETYSIVLGAGNITDAAGNSWQGLGEGELSFTASNEPPGSNDDSASVEEDGDVIIAVLENDEDLSDGLDLSTLSVELLPLNGVTTVNTETGEITYAPNPNFNGVDSFTYVIADTQGSVSEPATVSVSISPVNDAPDAINDESSTKEAQSVVIAILDNDIDIDESSNLEPNAIDPTSVVIVEQPSSGTFVIVDETLANEDDSLQVGQVIYTPDLNFYGSDTFTYVVSDTLGAASLPATVSISVGFVNEQPIANDDSASTTEDESIAINVIANDSDREDELDASSVFIERQGSLGTATVDANTGLVTYTPTENRFGSDTFEYSVKDLDGLKSNIATVTVSIASVNDAPIALNDSYTIETRASSVLRILANDSDPDTEYEPSNTIDITSVSITTSPTLGVVSVNSATGEVTYTPNDDITSGTDAFTYVVNDTNGEASNTASVQIVLDLQSFSLVANDDVAQTNEDSPVTIVILSNDGDETRTIDPASVSLVSEANNGSIVVNENGSVIYTPNANFFGEDEFKYTVRDTGGELSNTANVSVSVISVNDAPIISGVPSTSVIAGQSYQFTPTVVDVDSNSFSYRIDNQPSWVNFDSNSGGLVGSPTESDVGVYSNIVITVQDGAGGSDSLESFSIEVVSVGTLTPVAMPADVSVLEDNSVAFQLIATDPNQLPLSYELVQQPQSGVITGVLPSVTYTPNENYAGTDSFTFVATNGEYTSEPALISIDVLPVNDAPVAFDDEAEVVEGQTVSIDVLANDTDVDVGDMLSITRVQAAQGDASIIDNTLSYQADANFIGSVIVDYTISDTEGLTASAQVVIDVIADANRESNITLEIPDDVEVFATGLVTRVPLGEAVATDNFDNRISTSLLGSPFFKPGKHTVVWRAESGDEVQQRSQRVTVHPLINVIPAQRVEEGRIAKVDVFLNGPAPHYPLNIPYTVSGTSDNGDHNVNDGVLVIESGTQASMLVDIEQDGVEEGDETLIITLSSSNNISNGVHTITIVEEGVAPQIQLTATQNNTSVTTVYPQDGVVEINLTLLNKALGDIASVDWSDSAIELNALNVSSSDTAFIFSPETLSAGIYHVKASVTDIKGLTGFADLTLQLSDQPPQLTNIDTDNDGIPDDEEGYGDSDGDGIPDYLDAANECNIQPVDAENVASFLVEGDSGACFKLGDIAMGSGNTIALDDSNLPPDNETTNVSTVIDFAVSGLNEAGQSYRVVIPQRNIIPDGAIYRKYDSQLEAWKDFDASGMADAIHSAKGEQGICPPPGDGSYVEGLTAGHWCLQLTISDGGPNDDDGAANGMIVDPSGLVVLASDNNPPVANNDVLRFDTDSTVVLNVLDNDADTDGDTLIIISADAYLGQAEISNSELLYTPPADFVGTDTLVYAISDGNGGTASATAQLTVNVNSVPQAEDDTAQTDNQTAVVIDVLANDSDADGDALTIISADVDSGSVSISDNKLTFTPELGFTGIATINYQVEDDKGARASASVAVTVTSRLNQAPNAQDDTATTNNESSITVNVLANDSDPDGDELTLVSVEASVGSASIENNQVVYVPQNNFVGSAVVTYVVTDGEFEASAALTINVTSNATTPQPKKSGGSFPILLMLLLVLILAYRLGENARQRNYY